MSLILDALKKSEQMRQSGDTVWSTQSQRGLSRRTPLWAWALIVLLLINVLILIGVVALRPPSPDSGSPSSVSTALDHLDPAAEASSAISRPTAETGSSSSLSSLQSKSPNSSRETRDNLQLSVVPPAASLTTPSVTVPAPAFAAIPSRDAVLAQGAAIPAVNLTLHVFDPVPSARFVLLDGERLGEGDTSKTGLRINAITSEGVVFNFDGNTFKVSL